MKKWPATESEIDFDLMNRVVYDKKKMKVRRFALYDFDLVLFISLIECILIMMV